MNKYHVRYSLLFLLLTTTAAKSDEDSIGTLGINSKGTGLDGSGVLIGQAEPTRSGKAGYDDADHSADNVFPAGVYFQLAAGMDAMNSHIDDHATSVAGIMIGKAEPNALFEGVSPNAELHSIGFGCIGDSHLHIRNCFAGGRRIVVGSMGTTSNCRRP